jgi:hypothetical protein
MLLVSLASGYARKMPRKRRKVIAEGVPDQRHQY